MIDEVFDQQGNVFSFFPAEEESQSEKTIEAVKTDRYEMHPTADGKPPGRDWWRLRPAQLARIG